VAVLQKLTIKQNQNVLSSEHPSNPMEDLKERFTVSCQLTWQGTRQPRCLDHDAPVTQDTALPQKTGKLQMLALKQSTWVFTGLHHEVGSMVFTSKESHGHLEDTGATRKSAVLLLFRRAKGGSESFEVFLC